MIVLKRATDSTALCPICNQVSHLIRSLEFSEREALPTKISVHVCKQCSFGFTFPRPKVPYEQIYGGYKNDLLGENWQVSKTQRERYKDQISVLAKYLSDDRELRVLDFGCGEGGLLETMAHEYKRHRYFGCDANAQARVTPAGVSIYRDLRNLIDSFDVIVLSHVIEHLIDFDILGQVFKLLSPTGIVYIEVPNAVAYQSYPRREFLYYFDRLHVNHFTFPALEKLLLFFSLAPLEFGKQDFRYKDNGLYPAIYGIFSRGHETLPVESMELDVKFQRYVEAEITRLRIVNAALPKDREVIVYGFGDNFFRQFGDGGPLNDILIAAVVDQRSIELSRSMYAARYQFFDVDAAAAKFALATWLITVSWGWGDIAKRLKARGIKDSQIIIL